MQIKGAITGVKYTPSLMKELSTFDLEGHFDFNQAPASFLLQIDGTAMALSKWVSPKRTRSYPYERVYNTLGSVKKVTIIPVIKDEGQRGDRDYLQWDTVALMSLLEVYVIIAYYDQAEPHRSRANKITNQRINQEFVLEKIQEIQNYHSSALHWNLQEVHNIAIYANLARDSYNRISKELKVEMHSSRGIDNFIAKIGEGHEAFMESSRNKAKQAQNREFLTVQPKEALSTLTKAKITINNYLGGEYFFTVDEVEINHTDKIIDLIEAKHSRNAILPSEGDIKDGLLKLILYSNLSDVTIDGETYTSRPVIKLTSSRIAGKITSEDLNKTIIDFLDKNNYNNRKQEFVIKLFKEGQANNIKVIIEHAV